MKDRRILFPKTVVGETHGETNTDPIFLRPHFSKCHCPILSITGSACKVELAKPIIVRVAIRTTPPPNDNYREPLNILLSLPRGSM